MKYFLVCFLFIGVFFTNNVVANDNNVYVKNTGVSVSPISEDEFDEIALEKQNYKSSSESGVQSLKIMTRSMNANVEKDSAKADAPVSSENFLRGEEIK